MKDLASLDSHTVAEKLLGSKICRRYNGADFCITVSEVEVYDGLEDKASHASKGKTKRTAVMYGPAGYWYVYLVYGMHWMLNFVTREEGYPAAILIRGGIAEDGKKITGPGRVAKFLMLDKTFDSTRADETSDLWINWHTKPLTQKIETSPRIGIAYAGPEWSKKPWRYTIEL